VTYTLFKLLLIPAAIGVALCWAKIHDYFSLEYRIKKTADEAKDTFRRV
jgi:hypothetical protein